MQQAVNKDRKSFEDLARATFKGAFVPMATFLNRIGVRPNTVTVAGLVGHAVAAYLVTTGHITWAGLLLLVMAPFDFLDGTMARLRGESSTFGAFIDSVTDRYSEFVIMGGLLAYYLQRGDWTSCMVIYFAAAGSQLVSYTRGRAEALGYNGKVGILTRVERYFVLIPSLIFNYPMVGMWIIAIFANITAIQRIIYVRKQAYNKIK